MTSEQIISSTYQGALFATKSIDTDTTSGVDGPLCGDAVNLGQSATTSFPTITVVPVGMPSNPTVYAQPQSLVVAGDALVRAGDAQHRTDEVGDVDHGQQQARHPEQMNVGEQRKQAEHRDDLELQLVAAMGHALRHGVQPKEQDADTQDGGKQNEAGDHQQRIGAIRAGQEGRQVVRCGRVLRGIQARCLPGRRTDAKPRASANFSIDICCAGKLMSFRACLPVETRRYRAAALGDHGSE